MQSVNEAGGQKANMKAKEMKNEVQVQMQLEFNSYRESSSDTHALPVLVDAQRAGSRDCPLSMDTPPSVQSPTRATFRSDQQC